jgi:phosphopantothenoylcysteine decarboxylase/phosphopantothenate--cysteine ligase
MAAAVADFRPKVAAGSKLKKEGGPPEVILEPTVDILAELGRNKATGQILVGFAAETDDLLDNARSKLERKNLDLIVANDVSAPATGFEHDTNAVILLGAGGIAEHVDLTSKTAVAAIVADRVADLLG